MRKFFIGILLLAMTATMNAAPRTAQEAAALAASFSNSQSQKSGIKKAARATAADMSLVHQVAKPTNMFEPALYVFSKPQGGWVIVSADDNAVSILAYSNEGEFSINPNEGEFSINPNAEYMLDYYAEQIALAKPLSADQRIRRAKAEDEYVGEAVTPLLGTGSNATQWDQRSRYNWFCPMDQADDTRCATGCVATAAAMIMYHFRYPATGMGTSSYSWKNVGGGSGQEYADFRTGNYDWDHMLPQYHSGYTTEQGEAVAKLMYHCGVACEMEYGGEVTGGSGSNGSAMADGMHKYFGYKKGVNHKHWEDSTYEAEAKAFENELKANRIILMGGNGHAFVCDGADGEGKFHINFGWSGASDGFYSLRAMIATEGAPGNYSEGMSSIFGIEPEDESTYVHVTNISLAETQISMNVRDRRGLSVTISPNKKEEGIDKEATNKGVYYYSSDESVATVSGSGTITGISVGHAIITAASCDGNLTATCEVTVGNNVVEGMELTFDKVFEQKYSSSSARWKIGIENKAQGEYPYLYLYFPKSGNYIAGHYNLDGKNAWIEGWTTADDPGHTTKSASGWLNIGYVSAGIYKMDCYFVGEDGITYTFSYTNASKYAINMGTTLTDAEGDGAMPSNLYYANFKAMGEDYAVTCSSDGKLVLPSKKPLNCNEMEFVGWTAEQNYSSDVAPAMVQNGDAIDGNKTYYAVFAIPTGAGNYTEVASIQFDAADASTPSNVLDSTWYFYPQGNAIEGANVMNDFVVSSNNLSVTGGAWVRQGKQGLRVGAHKSDNVWEKSTNYDRKKNKQGYLILTLDQAATISKITVSAEHTTSHDDGRILVDPNSVHTQDPIVTGEDVEYILNEPTSTKTLELTSNHRIFALKNIKMYTGGTNYVGYTTTSCPSHDINIASMENGSVETDLSSAMLDDMVTITVNPAYGYALQSLSVKDANNNELNIKNGEFFMPASDVTISAVFEAVEYGITVEDATHGQVTTDKATATAGETITITTTSDENYELASISVVDADSQAVAVENGQFIMPASNVTISATFSAIQYNINIDDPENGSIKSDKATAAAGEVVTITIQADDKYTLSWINVYSSVAGNIAVDQNNQFIMPAGDVTVSAGFTAIKYAINKNATENGTISCLSEAAEGQVVTINANPANNYRLASLSVKDTADNEIAVTNGQFTMPAGEVTIYAEFERVYIVNISTSIVNGSVVADPAQAAADETVTLTASAESGYKLTTLSVSGGPMIGQIAVTNGQFTMPAGNVTVMAYFEQEIKEYNIMVFPNIQNGTVTPDVNKAIEGQIVTLTIVPADGYKLATLTVSAPKIGTIDVDENYQFEMPASGVSVSATFVEDITTGINGINAGEKVTKMIENGVVYIIRGGEKFDIYGQKVQ